MKEFIIVDNQGIVYYIEASCFASCKAKAIELGIKIWIIRQTN